MTNNEEGESDIGMAIGSPRQVVNNGAIFILSRTVVSVQVYTPSSLRGRGSRGSSVCD